MTEESDKDEELYWWQMESDNPTMEKYVKMLIVKYENNDKLLDKVVGMTDRRHRINRLKSKSEKDIKRRKDLGMEIDERDEFARLNNINYEDEFDEIKKFDFGTVYSHNWLPNKNEHLW